ncbi:MAG: phosphoribosylglycinamide formyltransferase [Pseudomonadota bacterium]
MNNPARIAVLISGSGSNLQALLDHTQRPSFPGNVVAVISDNPGAYGLQRAQRAGIDTTVVERAPLASRSAFDNALAAAVDACTPDIVVLAGFMRIIRGALVERYAGRMLNIHPALLPKYKGLNTHQRCLDNGDLMHGTTVHFVSAELDGGPAVIQAELTVEPDDSSDSLMTRVQALEHTIYPMAVRWLAEGRLKLARDAVYLDGQALDAPVVVSAASLVA